MNGMFKDKNNYEKKNYRSSHDEWNGLQRLKSGGQTKKKFIQKLVISSITSDKWID